VSNDTSVVGTLRLRIQKGAEAGVPFIKGVIDDFAPSPFAEDIVKSSSSWLQ
jgi:hypothetical protein